MTKKVKISLGELAGRGNVTISAIVDEYGNDGKPFFCRIENNPLVSEQVIVYDIGGTFTAPKDVEVILYVEVILRTV